MSRHHCGQHPNRGRSNYQVRLGKRGLSKAPALQHVDDLRRIQLARKERTGFLYPTSAETEEEQVA